MYVCVCVCVCIENIFTLLYTTLPSVEGVSGRGEWEGSLGVAMGGLRKEGGGGMSGRVEGGSRERDEREEGGNGDWEGWEG